jgi:hypothetical protein
LEVVLGDDRGVGIGVGGAWFGFGTGGVRAGMLDDVL